MERCQAELVALVDRLRAEPHETEWLEFKEAKSSFPFDELGKYFSALSNEARLAGLDCGWLVFGVANDLPRQVVGSGYRAQPPGLDKLKKQIAMYTNHQLTFAAVHEVQYAGKRVVLFQIAAAPVGIPATWHGIAYGRVGDSLGPLSLSEIDTIRGGAGIEDWSARPCVGATLADLDAAAIDFAREQYLQKHPGLAGEVAQWSNETFLTKARAYVSGQVTRAAVVLLGRPESERLLSPSVASVTWVLKDQQGTDRDYQHFGPPLILAVGQVFSKVRNLTYRYMPDATLFPKEVSQYDLWVLREMLHNAIAHQDYAKASRVNVVEEPESVLVTNAGEFLPGSVEQVLVQDAPPAFYRNRLLSQVMVDFNMIDTIGSGIKRMFLKQRDRFFPMPDYDLGQPGQVCVRITGKVIDERYTRLLMQRLDLSLADVIVLDKVQKHRPLTEDEFQSVKSKALVEGRRPNLYVSARVAAATETWDDYVQKRAFDKDYYKRLVVGYLEKCGSATRQKLDGLLLRKLSDALTERQKAVYVMNLLQELRRNRVIRIRPGGSQRGPNAIWELHRPEQKDMR